MKQALFLFYGHPVFAGVYTNTKCVEVAIRSCTDVVGLLVLLYASMCLHPCCAVELKQEEDMHLFLMEKQLKIF